MTVALAAAKTVLAQQMQTYLPPGVAAKPKGPIVFLDYDKDEIDFAYDQVKELFDGACDVEESAG